MPVTSVRALRMLMHVALALGACAPREDISASNNTSCAVYRSFVAEFAPYQRQFMFLSTSSPEIAARRNEGRPAPREFEEGSGIFQPPPDRPRNRFSEDTTGYFDALQSQPEVNIEACFSQDGPIFSRDSYEQTVDDFLEMQSRQGNNYIPSPNDINSVWQVSPVAVSPDGRHALMLGGFFCGGLCGGGAYYLFERRSEGWELIGHHTAWIS